MSLIRKIQANILDFVYGLKIKKLEKENRAEDQRNIELMKEIEFQKELDKMAKKEQDELEYLEQLKELRIQKEMDIYNSNTYTICTTCQTKQILWEIDIHDA